MEAKKDHKTETPCLKVDELDVAEVLGIIKQNVPAWANVTESTLQYQRMTGLTNRTFRLSVSNGIAQGITEPQSIFLRVFDKDGLFFDRRREVQVLEHINSWGLGPKPYAYEGKYRFEEFFEATRTLETTEMNIPHVRRNLAYTLAKFHQMKPDFIKQIPLINTIYEGSNIRKAYFDKITRETQNENFTADEIDMLADITQLLSEKERDFIQSVAPASGKSLVFSHNDLLPGNILILPSRRFIFVDYEYSSFNYRGYDLANYLNEAILDYNVLEAPYFKVREEFNPSQSDIDDLIFYYCIFSQAKELKIGEETMAQWVEDGIDAVKRDEYLQTDLIKNEMKSIQEEIKSCMLMSHIYWIIWAVIMSKNDQIAFDYVKFAHERYKLYTRLKGQWYPQTVPEAETKPVVDSAPTFKAETEKITV